LATGRVAGNAGARVSELGFARLIHLAKGHAALASALAGRSDIPAELQPFLELARE
jgi:hypothetical protein